MDYFLSIFWRNRKDSWTCSWKESLHFLVSFDIRWSISLGLRFYSFLDKAKEDIDQIVKSFKYSEDAYSDAVSFYGESPKEMGCEEFFGTIVKFNEAVTEIINSNKEAVLKMEKEKRREEAKMKAEEEKKKRKGKEFSTSFLWMIMDHTLHFVETMRSHWCKEWSMNIHSKCIQVSLNFHWKFIRWWARVGRRWSVWSSQRWRNFQKPKRKTRTW